MSRFQFRFAAVLRFRNHVKRQRQLELAILNEKRAELEAGIAYLEHECDSAAAFSGERVVYAAVDFRLRADYVSSLLLRLSEKRDQLASLETELTAKRAEVIDAMRSVKVLELLSDRLAQKFWRDLQVRDQKLNDEIGLRKFIE